MQRKSLDSNPIVYWTNVCSGPCLVLLHPACCDHRCFSEQVRCLGDRYKIIVPDLLGHGASRGYGYLTDMSRWLREIIAAEDVPEIHLVGVGLGSLIAQDFANRYPSFVASLFCCGSNDIRDVKDIDNYRSRELFRAMMNPRQFAAENLCNFCCTEAGRAKIESAILSFPKSSWRHFATLRRFLRDSGRRPRGYPFAIGVGTDDPSETRAAALAWAAREEDAVRILFPEAGRLVHLDRPDLFNKELDEFLRQVAVYRAENPRAGWPERLFS